MPHGNRRPAPQRNALIGNLLGQCILIGVTPFLTRIYSPADFGVYQVGLFVASFILPLSTLRVEQIIPGMRSYGGVLFWTRRAVRTTILWIFALLVASLAIGILLDWLAAEPVILAAVLVAALALSVVDNAILIRQEEYNRLAIRNLLSGVLAAVAQVLLGLYWASPLALGLSLAMGRLLSVLLTRRKGPTRVEDSEGELYPPSKMAFAIAAGCLSAASLQLPAAIFVAGAGAGPAGQVSLAQRVAGAPSTLLSQGLGQIVAGNCGQRIRLCRPTLGAYLLKFSVTVLFAAAVGIALLVAVLLRFHEEIFGQGWELVGRSAAILAPMYALQLAISPITALLPLLGHQRILFFYEVARSSCLTLSIATVFTMSTDILIALITWSGIGSALYLVLFAIVLSSARKHDQRNRDYDGTPSTLASQKP